MVSASPSGRLGHGIEDPFISVDVPFELARLQASPAYGREGHAGMTVNKYPELRVVLEAMKAGVQIQIHETTEELTVQLVFGQLRILMPYGESRELSEGSLAAVGAGKVHALEALEDCGFVLTLGWPPLERRVEGGDEGETGGAGI